MAQEIKELFVKKCQDFACAPIQAFLEDLDALQGASPTDVRLVGSSKRLFKNRITPVQVFALCETLRDDISVVALDLSNNFLDNMAAQAIAGLIKANRTLRFINLAGNDIGPEGAKHLASALSAPDCALQAISLTGNPLEEEGTMAFGAMLRTNTSLRGLDLSNVRAGVKGLISLCTALMEEEGGNRSLEVLDIGAPVIHMQQDTVVLNVARMLACNSVLTELGLSKHKLVDSQLETLVTYGLLRNTSLTSLDVRANKLSGFSGPQLERLLTESQRIASLNLAGNMLGDTGATCIARCLPYSTWLTRLDLRSNNIGEQGMVALAEALGLASHLQLLLLWGNVFGPVASKALMDGLGPDGGQHGRLVIDVKPWQVDGVCQVALVQVEGEEGA